MKSHHIGALALLSLGLIASAEESPLESILAKLRASPHPEVAAGDAAALQTEHVAALKADLARRQTAWEKEVEDEK